jgi:hypothetical protein
MRMKNSLEYLLHQGAMLLAPRLHFRHLQRKIIAYEI